MPAAIPAHVVTGPLGSGKTTAIARLLAEKPPQQDWVVLLNEFSDAGIDALTVASAARGAFDVRLVPGGCLCCAGEQDFRRNLQELVTTRRPDRILVEPSGLGHPAGIVEELLGWEATGRLRLAGIVALVDPQRLRDGAALVPGSEAYAQIEIADALALSKADLADGEDLRRFEALAASLFPRKAWSGPVVEGRLPPEAFEPLRTVARAPLMPSQSPRHEAERLYGRAVHDGHGVLLSGHDAAGNRCHPAARNEAVAAESDVAAVGDEITAANGRRREVHHIGHRAIRWVFPRAVEFSRPRLASLLAAAGAGAAPLGGGVARLKGVFRIAEDEWVVAQVERHGVAMRPTSWRRDSRVELLLDGDAPCEPQAWDAAWRGTQRR